MTMDRQYHILRKARNEYGKQVRKAYENHEISERRCNMTDYVPRTDGISNTLTTVQSDNYMLEVRGGGYNDMQHNPVTWGGLQEHQTPRNDGISPTLTAAMGMGGGQTPIFTEERGDGVGKVGQISSEGSQCGSVFSDDGNMATLTAGTHGDANPRIYTDFRIRKLTPRECWRLMGFTDRDFDKASEVNSNTQLYKQAGNSIVKHVLMAIFGQMIPGKEDVYKKYGTEQEE